MRELHNVPYRQLGLAVLALGHVSARTQDNARLQLCGLRPYRLQRGIDLNQTDTKTMQEFDENDWVLRGGPCVATSCQTRTRQSGAKCANGRTSRHHILNRENAVVILLQKLNVGLRMGVAKPLHATGKQ